MRICILGATGLVGQETLDLCLAAWPGAELSLYASRDKTLTRGGKTWEVSAASKLEGGDAAKGDLALVALDDTHSKRYVPRLLELGYRVVDKSNTFRMDPQVPLVVASVNCGRVAEDTKLVANPNCTTIPFALAVGPLLREFGLRSATVASYQAISGAGIGALDAFLEDAKRGYAQGDRLGAAFDATKYAGNTVPHNGKTDDSGFSSEERKLVNEGRKILEQPELGINAQCCRVPVAVGHYLSAWITTGRPAEPSSLEAALGDRTVAPFVQVVPGPEGAGLSSLHCTQQRDKALIGRIRRDPRDEEGRSFCLTVVADNLRLGAATNAVRIASRWFPTKDTLLAAPGR